MLDSQEIHKPYKITFENGRVLAIEIDPSVEIKPNIPPSFDPKSCVVTENFGVFRMPEGPESFDTSAVSGFLDSIAVSGTAAKEG